jgi:sulfate transport system permease protein
MGVNAAAVARPRARRRVIPGFGLSLGITLAWLSLVVLIPLLGVALKTSGLGWQGVWQVWSEPRVLSALRVSFGTAFVAAAFNAVMGTWVAWVFVRYRFPGKRLFDAMIDLPFALPTAVAGIALTALYGGNGWVGQWLERPAQALVANLPTLAWLWPRLVLLLALSAGGYALLRPSHAVLPAPLLALRRLFGAVAAASLAAVCIGAMVIGYAGLMQASGADGIKVAYTQLGIVVALVFVGLPFVVRIVQPVLAEAEREVEEAAATLGAGRWQTIRRVVLPGLWPAVLTGFALAFARGVGEYGSVIFIAGNLPNATEIAPLLITIRLEEFDYAGATAIAAAMLLLSLLMLLVVNGVQARFARRGLAAQ